MSAMPNATDRQSRSPLDAALDIFRMRQYFNVIVRTRDVAAALRHDAGFLDAVRRGLLPLPTDQRVDPGPVFARPHGTPPRALDGRVGVVATGGSGALSSLVGVARALEETDTKVAVYSVCSGSALFGFPLGAGMPAAEVAEMMAALRPADYVDVGWREILTLLPTSARG
jgi:NTE family protein